MAESVFAMRLVNLRTVTCYTNQNFKENAHFRALSLFTSERKVEIELQQQYSVNNNIQALARIIILLLLMK